MDKKSKGRSLSGNHNYGIDALRVVSMLMVAILHINTHGGAMNGTDFLSVKYELAWFLETASFCAVNCFAMISGYVGVKTEFKVSSIVVLWLRVVYYTLGIAILYLLFSSENVGLKCVYKALTPVMSSEYWYFTAYFALFFFMPLLNAALNTIEKTRLKYCLILIILVFSGSQTLFNVDVFKTSNGYSAIWLIVLYLVGGYIKKYGLFDKWSNKKLICGYFLMVCISWVRKFMSEFCTYKLFGIEERTGFTMQYTSFTIFMAGVFLLLFFSRINFGKRMKCVIKTLAPLSFSVYLIHVNPLIWDNVLSNMFASYGKLPVIIFPFAIIGTGIAIVLICSAIDFVREFIFVKSDLKGRLLSLENMIKQKICK